MDIVYASNEGYAQHLGVSIYSLFDNNTDDVDMHVYVIDTGISEASKAKLNLIAGSFHREITYIGLDDIEDRVGYALDTGRFDISAMARLFVGELIPDDVTRIIYIDCDTVVAGKLSGLYDMDLGGCVIGAALEPTIYEDVKTYLDMDVDTPYYNSGVLLIDMVMWRSMDLGNKIREYYESINDVSLFCDQDAINGYLKGKIKTISPAYNMFTNYRYYSYEELTRRAAWFSRIPKKVYLHAIRHPRIVHFAGDERPWKMFNQNPYRALYDIYLDLTPWQGTAKEPANILYMTGYHMMNIVTLMCPGIRKRISDIYADRIKRDRIG